MSAKKQYVSLFAVILPTSGFLSSCHDKMNKNTGALQFDSIQINETTHFSNDTTKPVCNIIISLAYPAKSSDDMLEDSLNVYLIFVCSRDKYTGEKPEVVVEQYVKSHIGEHRHDQESMYTGDKKNKESDTVIGIWHFYYRSIESHVQLYEKDLLVCRIGYNECTGDAHDMYMSTSLNMDLTLMRPPHLNDILVGNSREALTDLTWNQLMVDNEVTTHEALEDMGYASTGDTAPTENLYLSKEGITPYYNTYNIMPCSMGPIKVTILRSMMERLLGSNPIFGDLRD